MWFISPYRVKLVRLVVSELPPLTASDTCFCLPFWFVKIGRGLSLTQTNTIHFSWKWCFPVPLSVVVY